MSEERICANCTHWFHLSFEGNIYGSDIGECKNGNSVFALTNRKHTCDRFASIEPATIEQPMPRPGNTEVLPLVIADLQARVALGTERYGRPLEVENGLDHMLHAYQEVLDLGLYMRAEIAVRAKMAQDILDLLEENVQLKKELHEATSTTSALDQNGKALA